MNTVLTNIKRTDCCLPSYFALEIIDVPSNLPFKKKYIFKEIYQTSFKLHT